MANIVWLCLYFRLYGGEKFKKVVEGKSEKIELERAGGAERRLLV